MAAPRPRSASRIALAAALLLGGPALLVLAGEAPPETNQTYQPTNAEWMGRYFDSTQPVDTVMGGPTNPVASVDITPAGPVQPGQTVTFDASRSHARHGTFFGGTSIINWVWDFGDGTQANAQVVTHAWAQAGVYRVSLIVHDDTGWRASRALTIQVGNAPCGAGPREIWVPTQGLRMHGWLSLPPGPGPFPALLQYGPYAPSPIGGCDDFVRNGYAQAWIAAPGREFSEGAWDLFGNQTQKGGYDAVEWLASQAWSSGKVGLHGVSGPAVGALLTAAASPPHLAAVVSKSSYADLYRDLAIPGGIPNGNTFLNVWVSSLTVQDEGSYGGLGPNGETVKHAADNVAVQAAVMTHPTFDSYWKERCIVCYPAPAAPVLYFGNQRDLWPRATVEVSRWIASTGGRAISVPGPHTYPDTSGWEAGRNAGDMLAGEARLWFDHFLLGKANGVEVRPPVLTFSTYGGDAAGAFDFGRWEMLDGFPSAKTQPLTFYLRAAGSDPTRPLFHGLATTPPAPLELPGLLPYAPDQGITSDYTGESVTAVAGLQEPWETHSLVYQTPILSGDVGVNGPADLSFDAILAGADLGFTVQVDDVWPDGSSHFVSKGSLLASHRAVDTTKSLYLGLGSEAILLRPFHPHTAESGQILLPGMAYHFDVEVWGIHNVFKTGHRLRLVLAAQDVAWHASAQPGASALVLTDAAHPAALHLAELPAARSQEPFPYS